MISNISSSVSSWTNTLFSQLDTSNKGYISESDLSSAFSSLDSTDSENSASKLFSTLDSDQDGKVTKDELASTLQSLSDQLNSQYDASRMASAMGQGMSPPPQDNGEEGDSGLTEDQVNSIASSTDDSNLSSLLSNVASNFSAADTDGDGKVTSKEAMDYQESTQSSSQTSDSTSSQTTASSTSDEAITKRILELLQAYSNNLANSNSSISLSA